MAPAVPPAPIKGAMQSTTGSGANIAGSALSGLTAGIGVSMGLQQGFGMTSAAAGPWGIAAGLATFALGIF